MTTPSVEQFEFVTFDVGRKYLARVVAQKGKKLIVRLFNKKTGEWHTKSESREREACIPLTATEAEESFPGCVTAWGNTTLAKVERTKNSGAIIAPAVLEEARKKTNDELVQIINEEWRGICVKLTSLAPYIQVVFERIDAGQEVGGFTSKKKFCEQVVNRTYGAVVFMLRGGNPTNTKRRTRKRSLAPERLALPSAPAAVTPVTPALQPVPEFVEGEWKLATFPADHFDEKRRGKPIKDQWVNTDGRRIQKMQIIKPGQEKKPFRDRERIDIYKVSDQHGSIENAPTLNVAKKTVRPVSTTAAMLEKADLIAKIIANEGSYDLVLTDQSREYLAMRRIVHDTEQEQDEDYRRKPQYHVTLTIEGSTKDAVLDIAKSVFGSKLKGVELVRHGFSRAEDLERAETMRDASLEIVGELHGDIEQWKENLPENFRGDKEEALEQCASKLEEIKEALEAVDFSDVEFPGKY
jgi:hypothetical protein